VDKPGGNWGKNRVKVPGNTAAGGWDGDGLRPAPAISTKSASNGGDFTPLESQRPSGPKGRRFKSCHLDQKPVRIARFCPVFFVCRAWRTSNRWKSGRGYLPPSVANRKLLVATPGGEEAV